MHKVANRSTREACVAFITYIIIEYTLITSRDAIILDNNVIHVERPLDILPKSPHF